jgi:hypothetical protein
MPVKLVGTTSRAPGAISGALTGTSLIAVAKELPVGQLWSQILILAAPTVTVVVSWTWNRVWHELRTRLILRQRTRHADLVKQDALEMLKDPNLDPKVREEAQRNLKLAELARLSAHRELIERGSQDY